MSASRGAAAERVRGAAETAVIAVALGLWADVLFYDANLGLNAALWLGVLVGALRYTGRHRVAGPTRAELACLALSFGAAAALAWRGSPALQAFLFLASGGFLVLAIAIRSGLPWRRAGVAMFAGALIAAGVAIAAGLHRVQSSIELRGRILRRSKENASAAARVLVIGVPILLVFTALFACADAVFEDRLTGLGDFRLPAVTQHLFWFGAGTWLAGGVIWAGFEGQRFQVPEPRIPEGRRLGPGEVGIILGALAALFALFVAVQLRYLFGGDDLVQESTGLTYAQYARRGFFELVAAAALLLSLLLLADWARRRGPRADLAFRVLAGLLVVLLFVVMASALERMRVYEQAFGLTELRLYVVAFLLWLAAVFVLLLRALVRANGDWFVVGSIGAAAVVLASLAAIGPDALIARRNLDRAYEVHPFDAEHAAHLGADAAPILAGRLDELTPEDACIVARSLLERWGEGSGDGLRSWNWSRSTAARAVDRHREELEQACIARS